MTEASAESPTLRAPIQLFQPLVMRKAVDEVVSVLVDAIHGGAVEPGERFPREVDLAERLDVSRNTINQAMARLEQAGVVTIRRGSRGGAVVQSHFVPPELLMPAPDGETTEIGEWLQARRPIETAATVLAAPRLTPADLDLLRDLVDKLEPLAGDPDEFMAVDLRFHAEIGRLSGNALLAQYLDDLMRRFLVLRTHYPVGHADFAQGIENQRRSLAALESRDEQRILDATDEHVGVVEQHFLGSRLPRWEPTPAR